jgi:hypothetical protein
MTIIIDGTVGANKAVVLDSSGKLPAIDGSLVTTLNATQVTTGSIATARLDTGTTNGKVLVLDGSGNMPAIAAGAMTGVSSATKSASDPTVSTNPSTGLGTKWINTTSGEIFILTDATAGENVWTSTGGTSGDVQPFVFQGSIAGYTHGGQQAGASGYDTIDKFSYASQADATDVGNLAITMWYVTGASSGTHGFAMCGGNDSTRKRTINKYSHSSDGNATDHGDATSDAAGSAGCTDAGNGYGYICGGAPSRIDKDKFAFSSNTTATDIGDLSVARDQCCGSSESTHGYVQGGINSNGSVMYDIIDRWSYAAGGNSSDVGNLTAGRYAESSGGSSATHGYTAGAYTPAYPWNIIDKYAFAASSNATDVGDLTANVQGNAVSSATNYGYSCGGQPPATINRIEQFSFTTDGNSTDWADLSQSRVYPGTSQV